MGWSVSEVGVLILTVAGLSLDVCTLCSVSRSLFVCMGVGGGVVCGGGGGVVWSR